MKLWHTVFLALALGCCPCEQECDAQVFARWSRRPTVAIRQWSRPVAVQSFQRSYSRITPYGAYQRVCGPNGCSVIRVR